MIIMASVTVQLTETYDLSTKVGRVGLLGIHTPSSAQINSQYPGLIQNFKFAHVDACNVVCACASMLPADPLNVGSGADEIAPQDLFNPILYKPVSNDSFDICLGRLKAAMSSQAYSSASSLDAVQDAFSASISDAQNKQFYYSELSSQGWRKAMPQQGFSMSGLYPICYEVLNSYGGMGDTTNYQSTTALDMESGVSTGGNPQSMFSTNRSPATFKGRSSRMPSIPLHNTLGTSASVLNAWPVTYVAVVMLPFAERNIMYYRMSITWRVTFHGLCRIQDYQSVFPSAATTYPFVYSSDYATQSKDATATTEFLDVFNEATIEKVM